MATSKKSTKNKSQVSKSNPLYSIYGARKSKSGKRVNISILTGEGDDIQWGTVSLPIEGSKSVKVKISDIDVKITIPRVDIGAEEDEDEEEDD